MLNKAQHRSACVRVCVRTFTASFPNLLCLLACLAMSRKIIAPPRGSHQQPADPSLCEHKFLSWKLAVPLSTFLQHWRLFSLASSSPFCYTKVHNRAKKSKAERNMLCSLRSVCICAGGGRILWSEICAQPLKYAWENRSGRWPRSIFGRHRSNASQ
jgi:hypothetical protein